MRLSSKSMGWSRRNDFSSFNRLDIGSFNFAYQEIWRILGIEFKIIFHNLIPFRKCLILTALRQCSEICAILVGHLQIFCPFLTQEKRWFLPPTRFLRQFVYLLFWLPYCFWFLDSDILILQGFCFLCGLKYWLFHRMDRSLIPSLS